MPRVHSISATPNLPPEPSHEDDIVFVGLNPNSHLEAEALAQHANVLAIHDRPQLNLESDASVAPFVAALALSRGQTFAITRLLAECSPQIRDELGQLCQIWARAEHGEPLGGRLVLSGHCYGSGMFGEGNGEFNFDALARLAQTLPRAASFIQDLAVDGCNSASLQNIDLFREAFPNLKTFWGYEGHAPGASSGAITHEARWEKATRGPTGHLDRRVASATRLGAEVAVWSKVDGFKDGKAQASRRTLEARVQEGRSFAAQADRGEVDVVETQVGPLRMHYESLQDLLRHPQTPASERDGLHREIEKTLKLLYYRSSLAAHFADHYARDLDAGYRALGQPTPEFGRLSRADALRESRAFLAAAGARPEEPALRRCADLLERGLLQLSPSLVPVSWA